MDRCTRTHFRQWTFLQSFLAVSVLLILSLLARATTAAQSAEQASQSQTWVGSGELMGQAYQFRVRLNAANNADSPPTFEGKLTTNDSDILELSNIVVTKEKLDFDLKHPELGTLTTQMKRVSNDAVMEFQDLQLVKGAILLNGQAVGQAVMVLATPTFKEDLDQYVGEFETDDNQLISITISDDYKPRLLLADSQQNTTHDLVRVGTNKFVSGIVYDKKQPIDSFIECLADRLVLRRVKETLIYRRRLQTFTPSTQLIGKNARQLLASKDVPSISIGIVHRNQLIYKSAFGFADRERKLLAKPDTLYQIGSISKTITATMLMKLVEEQKMSLDEPVQLHMPSNVRLSRVDQGLTLRHLVTHTSGLPRDSDKVRAIKVPQPSDLHQALDEVELEYSPGTRFSYSNLGFMILGDVVSHSKGASYEQCLQEMIAKPLSMDNTTSVFSESIQNAMAVHYWDEDSPRFPRPCLNFGGIPGCGGIVSNVPDMAKYLSWQLTGRKNETAILSRDSLLAMHQKQVPTGNWNNELGVAWFSSLSREQDILISHGGEVDGHSCNMIFSPSHEVGIIVMSNVGGSNIVDFSDWLMQQVIKDYRNQITPSPEVARKSGRQGKWGDMVWANKHTLKVDSDNYTARRNLGIALFQLRRYSEAKFELSKIPLKQDSTGISRLMLARIAAVHGDSQGGR